MKKHIPALLLASCRTPLTVAKISVILAIYDDLASLYEAGQPLLEGDPLGSFRDSALVHSSSEVWEDWLSDRCPASDPSDTTLAIDLSIKVHFQDGSLSLSQRTNIFIMFGESLD